MEREQKDKSFRIGELSKIAGITVRTIRYYEELGLLRDQKRTESKHRRYSERDLVYIKRIQQLKSYGLTLNEIIEIFELSKTDTTGEKRRSRLILRYKQKLLEALERKSKVEEYIQEISWHIDQLERVKNFQACPGEECRTCKYKEICRFAEP